MSDDLDVYQFPVTCFVVISSVTFNALLGITDLLTHHVHIK